MSEQRWTWDAWDDYGPMAIIDRERDIGWAIAKDYAHPQQLADYLNALECRLAAWKRRARWHNEVRQATRTRLTAAEAERDEWVRWHGDCPYWKQRAEAAEQRLATAEAERARLTNELRATKAGLIAAEIIMDERRDRIEAAEQKLVTATEALEETTSALLWASGCFQSEVEMQAWAKTGRPAVDAGLAALAAITGEAQTKTDA